MDEQKAPVTWRSMLQRINRRLAHEAQMLKKSREGRARANLGEYYILDMRTNTLIAWHVDPRKLAEELRILQPWEALVDDE